MSSGDKFLAFYSLSHLLLNPREDLGDPYLVGTTQLPYWSVESLLLGKMGIFFRFSLNKIFFLLSPSYKCFLSVFLIIIFIYSRIIMFHLLFFWVILPMDQFIYLASFKNRFPEKLPLLPTDRSIEKLGLLVVRQSDHGFVKVRSMCPLGKKSSLSDRSD